MLHNGCIFKVRSQDEVNCLERCAHSFLFGHTLAPCVHSPVLLGLIHLALQAGLATGQAIVGISDALRDDVSPGTLPPRWHL